VLTTQGQYVMSYKSPISCILNASVLANFRGQRMNMRKKIKEN